MSWSYVFYLSSAIYIFGGIIFVALISAKPEPWGQEKPESYEQETTINQKANCTVELNNLENDNANANSN